MLRVQLILFLFIMLLTGCDSCVDPGIAQTSTDTVKVPFKPQGADKNKPSTLWVDTQIKIDEKSELTFTVQGAIDYCETSAIDCFSSPNCDQVEVPAVFCQGGNQYGPQCSAKNAQADPLGYYVLTKLNVRRDDKLKISLIPQTLTIQCNEKFFKDNYIRIQNLENLVGADESKMDFFNSACVIKTSIKVNNTIIPLGPFEGQTIQRVVNDQKGPQGNKVCISELSQESESGWKKGLIDLAPYINTPSVKNLDCTKYTKGTYGERGEFDSYLLNYWCDNICLSGKCQQRKDLYYTIVDDELPSLQDMKDEEDNPGINSNKVLANLANLNKNAKIQLLAIKIGNNTNELHQNCISQEAKDKTNQNENSWCRPGYSCFPDTRAKYCTDFENAAVTELTLNTDYTVNYDANIPEPQPVRLGISDCYREGSSCNYGDNGYTGYNVQIEKNCAQTEGKKLCIYIGETPPDHEPDPLTDCCINAQDIEEAEKNNQTPLFTIFPFKEANDQDQNRRQVLICPQLANSKPKGNVYLGIQNATNSDTFQLQTVNQNNAYSVEFNLTPGSPLATFVTGIIETLIEALYGTKNALKNGIATTESGIQNGVMYHMYTSISSNFAPVITLLLALAVSIYGFMFLMGLIKQPHVVILMNLLKIAFIALLLTPEVSWNFFAVNIFDLIVRGTQSLINIFTGNSEVPFAFLDKSIGSLFLKETWLKILSLILAGPIGWIFFILLLWGVSILISVLFNAVLVYLMTIITFSILLLLAPIFITFLLFEKTKSLFEGWLGFLVKSAVEPIMLFAAIYMLNDLVMLSFFDVINFGACPDCLLPFEIVDGIGFCLFQFMVPMGHDPDLTFSQRIAAVGNNFLLNEPGYMGLPIALVAILKFIIIAKVLEQVSEYASSAASEISSIMNDTSIAAGHLAQQSIAGIFGMDEKSIATRKQLREDAAAYGPKDPQRLEFTPKRKGINTTNDFDGSRSEVKKKVLRVGAEDQGEGLTNVSGKDGAGRNFSLEANKDTATFVSGDKRTASLEKDTEGGYLATDSKGRVIQLAASDEGLTVEAAHSGDIQIASGSNGSRTFIKYDDGEAMVSREEDGSTTVQFADGLIGKINPEGHYEFGDSGGTLIGVREDNEGGLQFVAPVATNLTLNSGVNNRSETTPETEASSSNDDDNNT